MAEKRAAIVVAKWLKEQVGKDRTQTNDPEQAEELRGRAERFFSHLFVDFPSLMRIMLVKNLPLRCLICSRRPPYGSLGELKRHAHDRKRTRRKAEHLGYYDALTRARLPRYRTESSSDSGSDESD